MFQPHAYQYMTDMEKRKIALEVAVIDFLVLTENNSKIHLAKIFTFLRQR